MNQYLMAQCVHHIVDPRPFQLVVHAVRRGESKFPLEKSPNLYPGQKTKKTYVKQMRTSKKGFRSYLGALKEFWHTVRAGCFLQVSRICSNPPGPSDPLKSVIFKSKHMLFIFFLGGKLFPLLIHSKGFIGRLSFTWHFSASAGRCQPPVPTRVAE